MFLGHYAVGLAAKRWVPKFSLGTLVAAALFLDLVWALFLFLGMEHIRISPGITKSVPIDFYDWPLSHSLVMVLAWAALWALVGLITGKKDSRGAWILGGVVVSNWILDFIFHKSDLPILPSENTLYGVAHKYGLGLWNFPPGAIMLEVALFAAGFWIYLKSTKALDPMGRIALWAFGVVLVLLYAVDLKAAPPANPNLVALVGIGQLLFVAWAFWMDDRRKITVK